MGGRIYLESKVNKGVTFTIDYPQPDWKKWKIFTTAIL
jgi:hypothetical protein